MIVHERWEIVDRWWTEEPIHRSYMDVTINGERRILIQYEENGLWHTWSREGSKMDRQAGEQQKPDTPGQDGDLAEAPQPEQSPETGGEPQVDVDVDVDTSEGRPAEGDAKAESLDTGDGHQHS